MEPGSCKSQVGPSGTGHHGHASAYHVGPMLEPPNIPLTPEERRYRYSRPQPKARKGRSASHAPPKKKVGLVSAGELAKQIQRAKSRCTKLLVTLGTAPGIKRRLGRTQWRAAALGRALQRLARANLKPPSKPLCDPFIPTILDQAEFLQQMRRFIWACVEVFADTEDMEPEARLACVRRRLWGLGRRLELLSQAELVDEAALREMVSSAAEPAPTPEPPRNSKVIPFEQSRIVARDSRTQRIILAIGSSRTAFDITTRVTRLKPGTGDRPAPVIPLKQPAKGKESPAKKPL